MNMNRKTAATILATPYDAPPIGVNPSSAAATPIERKSTAPLSTVTSVSHSSNLHTLGKVFAYPLARRFIVMPQKANEQDQRAAPPNPQDQDDELETAEDDDEFEDGDEFDDEADTDEEDVEE